MSPPFYLFLKLNVKSSSLFYDPPFVNDDNLYNVSINNVKNQIFRNFFCKKVFWPTWIHLVVKAAGINCLLGFPMKSFEKTGVRRFSDVLSWCS